MSLGAKTVDWNELLKPKEFKKLYGPCVNSKEALNVITAALGREMADDKITLRTADPGPNKTPSSPKGRGRRCGCAYSTPSCPPPLRARRKSSTPDSDPSGGPRRVFLFRAGKFKLYRRLWRARGSRQSFYANAGTRHLASSKTERSTRRKLSPVGSGSPSSNGDSAGIRKVRQ